MNVLQMLTRFVKAVTPNMHSQRRQALEACVKSAIHQNKLTITQLGRGIHGKAFEKHKIKRVRISVIPNSDSGVIRSPVSRSFS